MKKRALGASGIEVAEIGLGCMGMSEFYGPSDEAESLATLRRAVELGVDFFDTADMYGIGHNERLLSALASSHPGVKIATKFGIVRELGKYERRIDNSPDYIVKACDASLQRLGIDYIDLYYAHRIDGSVPIEDMVGAMAGLVKAGKIKAIGLCEVSAKTLRRAHAVHPIAAVQSEMSLWTRDMEAEVLPACQELGVAFVAYSPLGRGMLTGAIAQDTEFAAGDFRNIAPRFTAEYRAANLRLVELLKALAAEKACSPSQLALAWLLRRAENIIPIPGTRKIARLEENIAAADIVLTPADVARLEAALPAGAAAGDRYPAAGQVGLNA